MVHTDWTASGRRRRPAELWGLVLLLAIGCGGEVGQSPAGGAGGTGGASGGGAAGSDGGAATGGTGGSGWTECSTPDFLFCGVPECPERPGCSLCMPSGGSAVYGACAESLSPDEAFGTPADGKILVSRDLPLIAPFVMNEAPFSAGVFLAAHGEADRLAYADRGVWTGEPIPAPKTCPQVSEIEICGGFCGGCPVGQICTGRSPKHPYGLCIPIKGGICSLDPKVKGDICEPTELCFVFKVEPEHQNVADAKGFCLTKGACQAAALNLPGGGRCE